MSLPWGYLFRESLRQAWRQRLLTVVAVTSLALAALYGGAWSLLWANARQWNRSLGQAEQLMVFLRPGLSPQKQTATLAAARAVEGVSDVALVTPAQAADELSKDPEVKSALALLGENPLPPALQVRLAVVLPSEAAAAAARLRSLDGVDEVDQGEADVENLLKASAIARTVLLGMLAVFSALALVIVAATLRLVAWSRREELGIMRLVGASHGFIRTPFIFGGLLQGLAGGTLAALALAALQSWLGASLKTSLNVDLSALLPQGVDPALAATLVLAAGALGLLGAAVALATVRVAYEGEETW